MNVFFVDSCKRTEAKFLKKSLEGLIDNLEELLIDFILESKKKSKERFLKEEFQNNF